MSRSFLRAAFAFALLLASVLGSAPGQAAVQAAAPRPTPVRAATPPIPPRRRPPGPRVSPVAPKPPGTMARPSHPVAGQSAADGGYVFVRQWDGARNGELDFPTGIAVDGAGNVYVADSDNNRVEKFDASGAYLTQWGRLGTGNGQFNQPVGVAVDGVGNVYVADSGNDRLEKFDSSGAFLIQWGSLGTGNGQLDDPQGIAVDGAGNVYVTDSSNSRVEKFDASGAYLTQWGSTGSGNGRFNDPQGIAVDGAGNVYVVDYGNSRVEVFAPASEVASSPLLRSSLSSVPADGASVATITLAGAPSSHRVRLASSRGSVDTISPATGVASSIGAFVATLRSGTPGAAVVTAQDLTTGQTFPASVSVTFTAVAGQSAPPPANSFGVAITGVTADHPLGGRYLQGVSLLDQISVAVDWGSGAPGQVNFVLNGKTYAETADASGASHAFDLGSDLIPGANSLQIVAVNAAGQLSNPQTFAPHSIAQPVWLTGLQAAGAIASAGTLTPDGTLDYKVTIPPDGFSLDAPSFGPAGSDTSIGFSVAGDFQIPLSCDAPTKITIDASAAPRMALASVELGGELNASGTLQATSVQCVVATPTGNVTVHITVYGTKNWPVLPFLVNFVAPGAGETLGDTLPSGVADLLGAVSLTGSLHGSFSSDALVLAQSPWLQWQGRRSAPVRS